MIKFINSKRILGIIIVITVSIVGIKIATNEEMNIKGVKYENGKVVEMDLGKYNKNKKYEEYPVYILNDGSEYNILKNDKVEVKYPKGLKIWYFNNKRIYLSNDDNTVGMDINYSKHMDKDVTAKEIVEKRKKIMEVEKKDFKYSNIEFKIDGNKIFETDIGESSEHGAVSEVIIYGRNIYDVRIIRNIELKNWDEIVKNIKESFKVL